MKCLHQILYLLLSCCLFTIYTAKAQSFTGYDVASYSGVYGTLYNPANILDNRVKADINLVGLSSAEENNVVKIKFKYTENAVSIISPTRKTGMGSFQTDVLGPSFMIRLSDKHAFAVSTRFRTQSNVDKLDASAVNLSLLKDVSSLNKSPILAPGSTIQA